MDDVGKTRVGGEGEARGGGAGWHGGVVDGRRNLENMFHYGILLVKIVLPGLCNKQTRNVCSGSS